MSDDSKTARSDQDDASKGGGDPRQATQPGDRGDAGPEETAQAPSPEEVDESGNGGEQSLEKELEALKAELAEHKDRYLRAAAEAENIRRRADNDVANARKFAIEGFASEILAVRDSLEIARSLEISEDDSSAVAKMKEGLDLTLKQLDSALSKFSVAPVDPQEGDKLDPERHQAMSTQETDNVPPNHIVSVIQKGYTIHDRLLRPAMVVVARKPESEAETAGEQA
ncbi:MAG TPA: nucleotide exchange factor GrpE [Arenicellales bacterium]|nr:nucleotide exchange factor GrpE [Arenicellales bacterium]